MENVESSNTDIKWQRQCDHISVSTWQNNTIFYRNHTKDTQ